MTRIRFCHFIDSSNANPLLYESVKFSDRSKIDYTVVSMSPAGELQKQMQSLGVESYSVEIGSRKQYLPAFLKLAWMLRRKKYHVIQVHSFEASLLGLPAAMMARVPVRIFSGHHSHEVPLYNSCRLLWTDSFLARRLATHVIAPSIHMKEIFINAHCVPAEKITVIDHGMDIDEWRKKAYAGGGFRKEAGWENRVIFGAVGRLFWVKNFANLIRAFAEAATSLVEPVLVIVGEGGDRRELEDLIAELGIGDRVKLIGRRTDIASVMNEFDVLIHPSLAESFGLIIPEALALEKPVIATRRGIADEVIRDGRNGLLIDCGSIDQLRVAILKMMSQHDKWPVMGVAGRSDVKRFSIKITQSKYDRLVMSLIQEHD